MPQRAPEVERVIERSKALLDAERHEENEALMRAAVERYPEDADLAIFAAIAALARDPEGAKTRVRRAAALAPEDPGVLTRCASLMVSLDEFDDAENYAHRAFRSAPEDFVLMTDLVYLLGRVAFARGDHARAEKLLTVAFEEEPNAIGHGAWLAQLRRAMGKPTDALEVIDLALGHRPSDQALHSLRNDILEELDDD